MLWHLTVAAARGCSRDTLVAITQDAVAAVAPAAHCTMHLAPRASDNKHVVAAATSRQPILVADGRGGDGGVGVGAPPSQPPLAPPFSVAVPPCALQFPKAWGVGAEASHADGHARAEGDAGAADDSVDVVLQVWCRPVCVCVCVCVCERERESMSMCMWFCAGGMGWFCVGTPVSILTVGVVSFQVDAPAPLSPFTIDTLGSIANAVRVGLTTLARLASLDNAQRQQAHHGNMAAAHSKALHSALRLSSSLEAVLASALAFQSKHDQADSGDVASHSHSHSHSRHPATSSTADRAYSASLRESLVGVVGEVLCREADAIAATRGASVLLVDDTPRSRQPPRPRQQPSTPPGSGGEDGDGAGVTAEARRPATSPAPASEAGGGWDAAASQSNASTTSATSATSTGGRGGLHTAAGGDTPAVVGVGPRRVEVYTHDVYRAMSKPPHVDRDMLVVPLVAPVLGEAALSQTLQLPWNVLTAHTPGVGTRPTNGASHGAGGDVPAHTTMHAVGVLFVPIPAHAWSDGVPSSTIPAQRASSGVAFGAGDTGADAGAAAGAGARATPDVHIPGVDRLWLRGVLQWATHAAVFVHTARVARLRCRAIDRAQHRLRVLFQQLQGVMRQSALAERRLEDFKSRIGTSTALAAFARVRMQWCVCVCACVCVAPSGKHGHLQCCMCVSNVLLMLPVVVFDVLCCAVLRCVCLPPCVADTCVCSDRT